MSVDPEEAMKALEGMQQVLELCVGYKNACITRGFSPEASEVLATDYHRTLLAYSLEAAVAKRTGKLDTPPDKPPVIRDVVQS